MHVVARAGCRDLADSLGSGARSHELARRAEGLACCAAEGVLLEEGGGGVAGSVAALFGCVPGKHCVADLLRLGEYFVAIH